MFEGVIKNPTKNRYIVKQGKKTLIVEPGTHTVKIIDEKLVKKARTIKGLSFRVKVAVKKAEKKVAVAKKIVENEVTKQSVKKAKRKPVKK